MALGRDIFTRPAVSAHEGLPATALPATAFAQRLDSISDGISASKSLGNHVIRLRTLHPFCCRTTLSRARWTIAKAMGGAYRCLYERQRSHLQALHSETSAATHRITLGRGDVQQVCSKNDAQTDKVADYMEPMPEAVGPLREAMAAGLRIHKLILMDTAEAIARMRPEVERFMGDGVTLVQVIRPRSPGSVGRVAFPSPLPHITRQRRRESRPHPPSMHTHLSPCTAHARVGQSVTPLGEGFTRAYTVALVSRSLQKSRDPW